ncbi:hypothetical protein NQ317_017952 [Molorchus minor]|uniref:BTB domain-containing protein n=1 Tax=Molorchus minor TaxID=1323400 RepID=A0ABQ9JF67_9CUCU|nr:hypothetical protein NQ317_017952 [Molorchus minor]
MSTGASADSPDCTNQCRSTQHGDIITAAISKRSISDIDLCAFLTYICMRCESVRDSAGRTAVHVAASCGRIELVKWLVRNRHADIDAKDKESGYTALHRSIFYGKLHVAVELFKLGAATSELDLDSLTMLEHAMKDGLKPESKCGELYSWGSNNNHLLGPQHARENPELLDVFHKEYPDESVQQICIDQFHSILITAAGRAYSCGHGQGVFRRDHSVFLCSDGNVYTCGLNTYRVLGHQPPPERLLVPKQLKHLSNDLTGVCTGRYHSVVWGPRALYTWGLNAGQLGHKVSNKNDTQYVMTPKAVKVIDLDKSLQVMVLLLSAPRRESVYVIHEFLCRKIASRQLNVVEISIVGGKLDSPCLNREVSKKFNWELKVVALTNNGNLLLWQESDPQPCRCIFSLNRPIFVKQVTININEILLVDDYGEAFKGYICQRKKRHSNNVDNGAKSSEKSAFHKFLEKDDCIMVQLKKISRIHRGSVFRVIRKGGTTAHSYNFFDFPEIVDSEMRSHFQILLEEAHESDDIHDILFKVDNKYFPAHSYIVCTKSPGLEKLVDNSNKGVVVLNDVHPDIFEQLLLFIYTGVCDLTTCGEEKKDSLKDLEIPSDMSAYEYYHKVKKSREKEEKKQVLKNPVRMLHELAKRFECSDLQKLLGNLDMHTGVIRMKNVNDIKNISKPFVFDRLLFPKLYDVTVRCRDDKELKAHKCILAARLEYFNNMFSMRWGGAETSEVTVPFPKSTAEALLEFLYTDSLSYLNSKDTDHLFRVLILADQLFVTRLKEQCELLLTNLLTLKNAIQLLSFAHVYNAEKLKRSCMKFIILNILPFLELRALEALEEDVLQELSDFYFQEKPEVWCRVITPYSTAASDEEIISISGAYPISLDAEVERVQTKKRKSRTHKPSISEKSNVETSLDAVIQFPDIPEVILDRKNDFTNIPSRLKSITLASEKVKSEDIEVRFMTLGSDTELSRSFESKGFPELSSPTQHSGGVLFSKTPPQKEKWDVKHRMVKMSQKQRKRLSSESNNIQSTPMSVQKNPWKTIPQISGPVSPTNKTFTIGEIISDEKKQRGNLVKITSKLLTFTQIEDRAIDELHRFYNSENVTDEIIVIERVAIGAIASPVWVPRTK